MLKLGTLKEKIIRIQELRRSNASGAVKSKKIYTRKLKHKNPPSK